MGRNVFALFGAVAVLLTAMVALTLSGAIPNNIDPLKCYGVTGAIEEPCDRPPVFVRTSLRNPRSD